VGGAPLVQEKYQGKETCDRVVVVVVMMMMIIIIQHEFRPFKSDLFWR
jgi:hypothetical protein